MVAILLSLASLATLILVLLADARQGYPRPTVSKPIPKPVDWHTLIPRMRIVLKQAFPTVPIGADRDIAIFQAADITGDGVPEAVIGLGTGGASSDLITVMRLDGAKPRVARLKDWKGKVFTLVFPEGASAMHGQSVELLPDKNALVLSSYMRDSLNPERVQDCCVSVFRWTRKTKTFDWNKTLSESRGRECKNKCAVN